VSNIKIAML